MALFVDNEGVQKRGKQKSFLKDLGIVEVSSVPKGANAEEGQQGLAAVTFMKIAKPESEGPRTITVTNNVDPQLLEDFLKSPEGQEAVLAIMNKQKPMKSEDGKKFPASDYAYVPESDKPSTWKLRLTSTPGGKPDPRIVGAAVAALGPGFRGQKVQLPGEARPAVVRRVRQAWLQANPNKDRGDLPKVLKSKEEDDMSLEKQVAELQKKLEVAEFMAALTDVEKAYYNGLSDTDKEAFAKMDAATRKETVEKVEKKKAEDDESFDMDGQTIRKSDVGAAAFTVLKAQQKRIADAEALAKEEKAKRIQKQLEDEAETLLSNLPGDRAEKAEMLKLVKSLPEDQQEAQMTMLKSANEAMGASFDEVGHSHTSVAKGDDALKKMAEDLAAKEGIDFFKAYDRVMRSPEGIKIYNQRKDQ